MDDPFFTAGKRAHGAPWGQHSSYVEDIYRTYKPSSIPQRDNKAFQKALEFRAREKHEFKQLRAQRDEYSELLYSGSIRAKELTDSLSSMTEQFSSLKAEHERHLASSTRIRDIDNVSPELGPETPKQLVAKSIGKTCQTAEREHSCENQVWVDRALNTVLRDDRLQMSTHQQVVQYVKSQYMREASEHPGVRLVAHAIT